ncbi:MAG: protein-glutamate O-methyltransferase CheR [Holophagae bacterium]
MTQNPPRVVLPEPVSGRDFDYVRTLVRDRTAIALDRSKVYLVNSRLMPLARSAGFSSVVDYIQHLRSLPIGEPHRRAVEAVVTTETSFFRDHFPFEALRQEVLPELIADRRTTTRSIVIWSAGCSSGQEPYSIAMMIRESFPELVTWNLRLLASDVSDGVLDRSRQGTYSQVEVNRGLPASFLVKYFSQRGTSWRLKDDIRSMVAFFRHNLVREAPALPPIDILCMRNVLIYFDLETKRRVLDRALRQLRPGGLLMLGTAETTLNLDDRFERLRIGRAVFYRSPERRTS